MPPAGGGAAARGGRGARHGVQAARVDRAAVVGSRRGEQDGG